MWLAEIFVTPKKNILDPQGEVIKKTLGHMGYKKVADVKQGKYFQVVINETAKPTATVKKMCEQLLVNQIIEDYTFKLEKVLEKIK